MGLSTATRLYSMADATLKQKADNLKDSITRDIADFNTRNIGTSRMDSFAALIEAFDNTTTDEELKGRINVEVIQKNEVADAIRKAIRQIRNMAEIQYKSVGKYKTFGFEDMANLSDNDLHRMTKRIIRVGTTLLPELQEQGLTAAHLTNLETLSTQLDKAIDSVGNAQEQRDLETQDRITKGNNLWSEMTTLASIGQTLYADTNPAKYNDYVLITSTPAAPTPPPPATNPV